MRVNIHWHRYTHTHTSTHTHTHTHTHTYEGTLCTRVHRHARTAHALAVLFHRDIALCTHMHTYTHTHTHTHTDLGAYTGMPARTHTHTHARTTPRTPCFLLQADDSICSVHPSPVDSTCGFSVRNLDVVLDNRPCPNARYSHVPPSVASDRIERAVPEGGITPDTQLFLASTVWVKTKWWEEFESSQSLPFFVDESTNQTVKMMQYISTRIRYANVSGE